MELTGLLRSGMWYGMGGVLMIIACILEFIIGNTMPGVAFGTYGTVTTPLMPESR